MQNLKEQFDQFDKDHPQIWAEFCKRVEDIWQRGIRHYSADAILHILRYHSIVSGKDAEDWKINNSYSAYYARKWQSKNPDRSDFFSTRIQKLKKAA